MSTDSEAAPKFAPFVGMAGIASAMIFGSTSSPNPRIGAAYGTAKSGIGIAGVGTFRPDLIMKCLIPVVMSGIIAVYSLVIAVLIAEDMAPPSTQSYSLFKYDNPLTHLPSRRHPREELGKLMRSGFMHLGCGLAVGMTGLAAGYCIGIVGDKGVRAYMEQSRVFVGMVLILIFGEVLGLYGLIVALILNTKSRG
ncbi:v-type proton ATPase 16 kDa proteolipid subunit 2 [Diatrype stigma]|uniref:V-type proton ATPase proteolipid subunit n=1 Tax=Diatrype stigma TaxID=117547 RepID=A0AAN9YU22_9PEZI